MTGRNYKVVIYKLTTGKYHVDVQDTNIEEDIYTTNTIDSANTYTLWGAKRWAKRAITQDKKKVYGTPFYVVLTEKEL